jgi:hypothetical protein
MFEKTIILEILCFSTSGCNCITLESRFFHDFYDIHVVILIVDLYFKAALKGTRIMVSKVHGAPSYGGRFAICWRRCRVFQES